MLIYLSHLQFHNKQVTHHEYEIETSNGRTITKRRKTKSTVMFGVSSYSINYRGSCFSIYKNT